MNKELKTFHSGAYIFSADLCIDTHILNETMNVFCRMPVFPESTAHLKEMAFEKAVYSEARLEENPATYSQVCRITEHSRENFTQDTSAIEVINISEAIKLTDKYSNRELSQELIAEVHHELIALLHDSNGDGYRNGGQKDDAKWLSETYMPPSSKIDVNLLMKTLIEWLEEDLKDINPIFKAILLHLHLKKIQPYSYANSHTARIMEIWYLKKSGVKFLPYILPQIYSDKVLEYYKCVEEFYRSGNAAPAVKLICDSIKDEVISIRDNTFIAIKDVMQTKYLTDLLDRKELIKRQFDLLNMLKNSGEVFRQEDLQLKKPYTVLYGKVSRTTVSRDIAKLLDMGLITESEGGYHFNKDI